MKQIWRKKEKNERKNTTTNRIAPFADECYSTTVSNVNTLQESIICDFNWNRFHVLAKKSVMHCLFTQRHKIMTKDKQRYTRAHRAVADTVFTISPVPISIFSPKSSYLYAWNAKFAIFQLNVLAHLCCHWILLLASNCIYANCLHFILHSEFY